MRASVGVVARGAFVSSSCNAGVASRRARLDPRQSVAAALPRPDGQQFLLTDALIDVPVLSTLSTAAGQRGRRGGGRRRILPVAARPAP